MNQEDALLESFLDGTLAGEDLAAFRARLRADPSLRAQVDLQQRADEALRRLFHSVPSAAGVAGLPSDAATRPMPESPPARRPQWRLALLAAALLLAAGLIFYFGPYGPGGRPFAPAPAGAGGGSPRPSTEDYFRSVVDAGFQPMWTCKDDAEFRKTTLDRLGVPILFRPDPAVVLVGWAYGRTPMSDDTSVLLARVDGREVVVLMDRSESQCRTVREAAGLHVFKRTLAGVIMYEISPRETPALLGRFYRAD
jgi:hypothetical protein